MNYDGPGIYRHYKGKFYFVVGLSQNTETQEVCVVYRPLYTTNWSHFVHRPKEMFDEMINYLGLKVNRFVKTGG